MTPEEDFEEVWVVKSDEEITQYLDTLTDTYKQNKLISLHSPLEISEGLWDRAYLIKGEMRCRGTMRYVDWKGVELRVYANSRT